MPTPTEPPDPRGRAAVALAVLSWGSGPIFVKLISLHGIALAVDRLWLGFVVLVAVAVVTGRRATRGAVRRSGPAGALFGANVAFFFTALKHASVAEVTLIASLSPVLILVVAGPWFGERVGGRDVGWTAVALVGAAIVVLGSSSRPHWSPTGDLLAVGALVTWTAYFLATKRARDHLGALEYQTGVMLAAAAVVTPVALLSGQAHGALHGHDWLWLAAFVLVPGAGGHVLMSWAHRHVDVSVSSVIVVAQPVVASAGAALFLGESLGLVQLVGGAVVLVAVAVVAGARRSAYDVPVGTSGSD